MVPGVRLTRAGAVATVVLDRPARFNALTRDVRLGLAAVLGELDADAGVRAVVLTGEGRAFCAGQDLDELPEDGDLGRLLADEYEPMVRALAGLRVPLVAAINGPAAGAGLGLALAADIRVMAEDAFLSAAFAGIGLVPDSGVSRLLVDAVGHGRAAEIALTGRRVPADEALALGLVARVVPTADVRGEADAIASRLAAGPTRALGLTRRLLRDAAHAPDLDAVLALERAAQAEAAATADFAEGVAAFRAKRPPAFEGR